MSIVSQNGETLHNHYHGNVLESGRLLLVDAGAETNMNYCSDFTRTIPVNGKFTVRQKDIYDIVLAANSRTFELARQALFTGKCTMPPHASSPTGSRSSD